MNSFFFPSQLIVCREYTRAEDQDWHLDHFCCLYCDKELGGKQYRPQNGQPYCLDCFAVAFTTVCEVVNSTYCSACAKTPTAYVSLLHTISLFLSLYVLTIDSFSLPLLLVSFPPCRSFSLYKLILKKTCGEQVTLDQPRLQHEELIWHGTDECFVCAFCSISLLGQPYLPRHGKVFCSKDHAKQFRSKSQK